ncbi:nucleoside 2-deoxyribosyltransferase domain-containing protein [Kitasatospora sp. MBT63]|uniref:nucleoside 2-deoxyribosyltransferase domain-containing protein n=1 Tax=Kitasatospora sp. MBT63 TaxID=1444768 RepID=UPI00068F1625|nr:nucleoside 2-deoxyribosyltransferase domain-containing protein [Kitasatospora sp. MBT63]
MTTHYLEAPADHLPDPDGPPTVFLAGGITGCPDWQADAAEELLAADLAVFNPRRADFPVGDPAEGPRQIAWEHRYLHRADLTLFWFCAEQVQPIALLELGAALGERRAIVVGTDPAYPRRLDVVEQVRLAAPAVPVHASLKETLAAAITAARPAARPS